MSDDSICFVVNPQARGGENGEEWNKVYDKISQKLNTQHDFVIADGIGTGVTSTIDAINDGYNKIISVGGEGTTNEVVNGIYKANTNNVTLGFIKGGTVNDYLRTINWPHNLDEQIDLLQNGDRRNIPLIKATGDVERVGINMADTGVTAKVAYMASVERKLKWIKGDFRYTLLALRAIFGWKNIPITINTNDREIEGDLSLFMAGFSYTIGGYRILPHAEPKGDKMAYTGAMGFSKFTMLRRMGMLKKGTHTEEIKGVYMGHSDKIVLQADEPFLFEIDGEPFSFNTNKIELESIPNAIQTVIP